MGNLEQYLQSQLDALDGRVDLDFPGSEYGEGVWVGAGVEVSPGARLIPPVVLGDGVKVAQGATVGPYCVVGRGSWIGRRASLSRCILWDGVFIGDGAEIKGAVLCDRVRIKQNACIFELATVGDDSQVEERSVIKPSVKVWPNKMVGKSSVVSESLVWGNVAFACAVKSCGLAGTVNIDVTPESVTRVCAAFGGLLERPSSVVVAGDGREASQMLRNAAACGFTSAGVDVVDLGHAPPSVVRFAIRLLGAAAGIAVKRGPGGGDAVVVELYDKKGINLSADWQRKINHALSRGDFSRVSGDAVGKVGVYPSAYSDYVGFLAQKTDAGVTGAQDLRIHVSCPSEVAGLIDMACSRLGLDVRHVGEVGEDAIRDIVVADTPPIGAVFSPSLETLSLIDEQGRDVSGDRLYMLVVRMLLEQHSGAVVVVPANFTRLAEETARNLGGRVIRSKTSPPALMYRMLEVSDQYGTSQFQVWYDALFQLVKLIEWRGKTGRTLADMIDGVPASVVVARDVPCSWEDKGRVMRRLVTAVSPREEDMLDGIRVHRGNSWGLVLPDADEPLYHVYGEAASFELAEDIADGLVRRIEDAKGARTEAD